MRANAAPHTGLPFVPQPAPDELLGSWLLRIAQLYGLGLTTLLSRLGARPTGDARVPHWFAICGDTVGLDSLSAATRLPRADLAAMAPHTCRPRWPEELGACEKCLVDAADAGQPITWNRSWMHPLATTCRIHGTWLTTVATRTLRHMRHAGDFEGLHQHLAAAQAVPNDEPACARDAMWLQDRCTARTDVMLTLPWGRTLHHELMRIVDAVAREVMSASVSNDCVCETPADCRVMSVKDFAFEPVGGKRVGMSLPTRLRQRQWMLGRVAHVLRLAPVLRTYHATWSAASIKRLASMSNASEAALAWVCPIAAELLQRQDMLRREFSISPTYFKANSKLLASFR